MKDSFESLIDGGESETSHPKRSHAVLWTGFYTGALLVIAMLAALVAGNRMPALEPYALERNAGFGAIFVLFMLIPVLRFLKQPPRMFASAMIAWVLFAGAYDLAGLYFRDLFTALRTPFQALIEGAIVYGVITGVCWVFEMMLHARRHPMVPDRKAARNVTSHLP
jgi:hypothetical protein